MRRATAILPLFVACTPGSPTAVNATELGTGALARVSSAVWQVEGEAGEAFGQAVELADLNNDGFDELIVGAPRATGEATASGAVYVFSGTPEGVGDLLVTVPGTQASSRFGQSVANVGDVNGDGYTDVAVGAYLYDNSSGATDAGAVFVFRGGPGGLDVTPFYTLEGGAAGDWLGFPVAAAGDVNGDGLADVIAAATNEATRGAVALLLGGPEAMVWGASWRGKAGDRQFGYSLTAGDFDADGLSEVVASTGIGAVYVFRGLGDEPLQRLEGAQGDAWGWMVASGGDLDGDGRDDLLIGAPAAAEKTGQVSVHRGNPSGVDPAPVTTLDGERPGDWFGLFGRFVGDLDRDGTVDVAVSAVTDYQSTQISGVVYAIRGGRVPTLYDTARLQTPSDTDIFGALGGPGDVDGDGHADLVVGAAGADIVRVFPGAVDADGDGVAAAEDCDDDDPWQGSHYRYFDEDSDGYGATDTRQVYCGPDEADWVRVGGDCDDTAPRTFPGAARNESNRWCAEDADNDGYGDVEPGAGVTPGSDCDDSSNQVFPGAFDIGNDGIDQDCDGEDAYYYYYGDDYYYYGDDYYWYGDDYYWYGDDWRGRRGWCWCGPSVGPFSSAWVLALVLVRRRRRS